ncbi:MAG: zinc-binding dehydrogenase [Cytophagales bacterium]|nr:zinc-binding dehydrogenase [Cytophagales bacterium]
MLPTAGTGVCVKVPAGLRGDLASFAHMANIAFTAIRKSSIELGDYVAITGMGAIGNLAAQLAQLQGAWVVGIDINDIRLAIAQKSGIKHTFNSAKTSLADGLKAFTQGAGVSTFIDASGMSAVVEQDMKNIAWNGEMILLGTPRAPYQSNLTDTLQKVHLLDNVQMKGALEFSIPTHPSDFGKHSIERNVAIVMQLMKEGRLVVEPFYTHLMNPKDCQEAYDGLKNKQEEYVGVVFDWSK